MIIDFVRRTLRLAKHDISPQIRREFAVTTIPMDVVKREIYKNIIKEEHSIEIAEALLAEGIPPETVAKCTHLDIEEVLGLIDP
jgi:hypothetical protein